MKHGESIRESEWITSEQGQEGFEQLLDFIQKEYFENFLDKLDETVQEATLKEIKEKTGTDILGIKKGIECKIPVLLEKISELSRHSDAKLLVSNSLRDVLGNSVTVIFRTFLKVAKKYNTPEMQKKINNKDSGVRAILDSFSKETAEYYLDSLCDNDEVLKLELATTEGYLGTYAEFFLRFPSGSKKTFYFKFFSELEKGNITEENVEEMLAPLDGEIIDKDAVRKSDLVNRTKSTSTPA